MIQQLLNMNNGKKFDVILMNPPYDKNLHLKFLEKTIEIADNVVSIQPTRWIVDPNAKFNKNSALKKYENSIAKYIKDLEIINDKNAETMFDAGFTMDLGIYICDENGGYNYKELSSDRLFDMIVSKLKDTVKNHIEFSVPKNAIIISLITGGNNGRKSNVIDLFWTFNKNETTEKGYKDVIYDKDGKRLDNGLTFKQNREKTAWGNVKIKDEQYNIKFDTIDQCINFFNFTKLDLFRYLFNKSVVAVNVHPEKLPFIGDYKKKWTNEMLYDYFDINKEDREYISNYVKNEFNQLKHRIETEIQLKHKNKKK